MKNMLPFGPKYYFIAPSLIGSGVGYLVSSKRTKACQQMWMAAENKRTYLTEMEKKS